MAREFDFANGVVHVDQVPLAQASKKTIGRNSR